MKDRWDVWRIVASEGFSASLVEIEGSWSLEDVWDANIYLDIIEDVHHYSRAK